MNSVVNIVFCGHVDHGKSTIVGRLLAELKVVSEEKIHTVKQYCENNSKPFEYAFLIDALKDERSQGITIEAARIFFGSSKRNYMILDAPGHVDFIKNMVTGAARADVAVIVLDAIQGVQENTKRHIHLLEFLGIRQVFVLINKIDQAEFNEEVFVKIKTEISQLTHRLNLNISHIIPVSGYYGDNLIHRSSKTSWYLGPSFLDSLDEVNFERHEDTLPFRMWVQDVYKFTENNDSRRIVAGCIASGRIAPEMELTFYPSGKRSRIKTIESLSGPILMAAAGESIGFTLQDDIFIQRGEIATDPNVKPVLSSRIVAKIFWLGRQSLGINSELTVKIGTANIKCRIRSIIEIFDVATLEKTSEDVIRANQFARLELELRKPILFDQENDCSQFKRFVLVRDYAIQGGGMIEESTDTNRVLYDRVINRNQKWIGGAVKREDRESKFEQKSCLLLVTGADSRKLICSKLERTLFAIGHQVFYLGMGSVIHGLDADISNSPVEREEHLRRLAELSHIMLEAGMIFVVTTQSITQEDIRILSSALPSSALITISIGDEGTLEARPFDICICGTDEETSVSKIIEELKAREVLQK